jgi:CRISPR-associated protein Csd2
VVEAPVEGEAAVAAEEADAKKKKPVKEKRKGSADEVGQARKWMCQNFFDVRTFGAVMSTGVNCGQVRGPVQLTFARSVEPIVALEHSITRMAVATEAEAEKQQGDNRTMGRKHTVPYGVYVAHGFVSSFLAKQTGFGDDDLELVFKALEQMFEHDRSAARGEMSTRGLYVFKHDSELGNASAHSLFDRLKVTAKEEGAVARSFDAYSVLFDGQGLSVGQTVQPASGVSLIRRC